MQKKILLASSALLATGLVANTAAADGHVTYSITADIAAYTNLAVPSKVDNGLGHYVDAVDATKSAPRIEDPVTDDNSVNVTVKDADGVSGTINLVKAAGGEFDGSVSVTGDNGITFSGANDGSTNLTVSGDFGSVYFNGDTAVDQLDINGDDAAVGIGGAGNTVYNTGDNAGDNADVDSVTFVSSTIAGGATVAVTMMNVYNEAYYVATDGAFALKEAGALDFEIAAKYATGPISAFFGFGTHAGNIAVGAKYSAGAISAAFGFSSAPTVVEYAASNLDDDDGDGKISDTELAIAVVNAAEAARTTSEVDFSAADTLAAQAESRNSILASGVAATKDLANAASTADGTVVGAQVIAAGYVAGDNADTLDDTSDDTASDTTGVTSAELNADFVDANKTGGIAFSVGYTTGAIGASFGVLIPANSDKYSLDSYKFVGNNPNTADEEETDAAPDVNTAAPEIAVNFNYDLGPGDYRLQILQQNAGLTVQTGIYAAF